MDTDYEYFKRDISWLSFNYRVLLEATDENLDIYERINFLSIYSSNLEEFYKIRVADHKAISTGRAKEEDETLQSAAQLIRDINKEVIKQIGKREEIYRYQILPELARQNIMFYQSYEELTQRQKEYTRNYFWQDIFPYLQPVPITLNKIKTFIRDNRIYIVVRLLESCSCTANRGVTEPLYFVIKQPYAKVPRFLELPSDDDKKYIMYTEDIIKANLGEIFPGYVVNGSYCIKISRGADIVIDEQAKGKELVKELREKVKKRKTGSVCRFVYDKTMPADFLCFLTDAFDIGKEELMPAEAHLNIEDLRMLPDIRANKQQTVKPKTAKLTVLNKADSIFKYVAKKDLLLHYPYHSFDHFIHFLHEAANDRHTTEIMTTQYRVAENSAVINALMAAAQNGKKVTVFVELKARFDEENNLSTAEMMESAGIKIIYSMPGLKVHSKVALIVRDSEKKANIKSYAYVSTGNFNEKTARLYADCGLFTSDDEVVNDLRKLFSTLHERQNHTFNAILVSQYNMLDELHRLIDNEIHNAKNGKRGRIVLKMNALQEITMINKLYEASQSGVDIDLIVRGICCLIPNREYSKNIRVTRIVDTFLEHARVWYFYSDGEEKVMMGSPDWMKRNLYKRIETVVKVKDKDIKRQLIDMLEIQLKDNVKACFVDENLNNVFKQPKAEEPRIRAQYAFADYVHSLNCQ